MRTGRRRPCSSHDGRDAMSRRCIRSLDRESWSRRDSSLRPHRHANRPSTSYRPSTSADDDSSPTSRSETVCWAGATESSLRQSDQTRIAGSHARQSSLKPTAIWLQRLCARPTPLYRVPAVGDDIRRRSTHSHGSANSDDIRTTFTHEPRCPSGTLDRQESTMRSSSLSADATSVTWMVRQPSSCAGPRFCGKSSR